MALNAVNINYSTAGLGTPASGQDFISGLISYFPVLPSGFASYSSVVQMYSVNDAIAAGITNTNIGASGATGSTTITASGGTGAVVNIIVNSLFGNVALGSYTVLSTDTLTTIATGVAAAINALSASTGYYAVSNGAVVTVFSPLANGSGGNSTTFANTFIGGATATNTTFSQGVSSFINELYYHINQAFLANPTLDLYVMVQSGSSVTQYSDITTLQNSTSGILRQVAVLETQANFSTSNLSLLQVQATSLSNNNTPLEIFYQCNYSGVSLSSLTDLTALASPAQNVTVLIGQDAGAVGYSLWLANNQTRSIGILGAFLGAVSSANVATSVAWVQNFNTIKGGEYDVLGFANGALYTSQSTNLITQVNNKQYVFMMEYVGLAGSYYNNDFTSITPTNTYSSVHINRVVHKVARQVRTALLPFIASPVVPNPNGTISTNSIAGFEAVTNTALAQMQSNSEIANYNTIINANQNVVATKMITETVQVQPIGVADIINVNLGLVVSVA